MCWLLFPSLEAQSKFCKTAKEAFLAALVALEKAVALAPGDAALLQKRDRLRTLSEATTVKSDWVAKQVEEAKKQDEEHRDKQVDEVSKRAEVREREPNATLALQRGNIAARCGELEAAIEHWKQSITHDRTTYQAMTYIGMVKRYQGKELEAIDWFKKSIRTEMAYLVPYYLCGNALQTIGKESEAESIYRKAVRLNPDSVQAQVSFAFSLLHQVRSLVDVCMDSLHCMLGRRLDIELSVCYQGKVEEAVEALKFAIKGGAEHKLKKCFEDPFPSFLLGYLLHLRGYTAEPCSYYLR